MQKYYFNDNKIDKRYITGGRQNNALYKDVYTYENNKPNGFIRYYTDTGEKVFTVKYSFFSTDDLPVAISSE